ncbi:hypothetical protein WH91_12490 [Devosia psychrophila]|nr:hypothetical protein WH91_12490 [Devosia psychrophila]
MSGALGRDEFIAYVKAYNEPFPGKNKSGVEEIAEVLNELGNSKRTVRRVDQSTRIFSPEDIAMSHCRNFELWSLSPAQFEVDNFLMWAAGQFPDAASVETRRVAVRRLNNDLSVALHLTVGGVVVLLGADLEEEGNPETGWSAALTASGRPRSKANLFKIPHHGSVTAHHEKVWDGMLEPSPLSIIAPWTIGSAMLPTADDVVRIQNHTPHLYVSAAIAGSRPKPRSATVEKMIKAAARSLVSARRSPGMIRVRSPINSPAVFKVELFGSAASL